MITADVIIIGAGAAGLMSAARAGQRGRKVVVLDRGAHAGPKIVISGGGRCNFTNRQMLPENFVSSNPNFCRSALAGFTPNNFVELVRKHKIPYHEQPNGQFFCDNSARDILDMLMSECRAGHVDIRLGQTVRKVTKADSFQVETEKETFAARSLVLATGGLSIPQMGASDFTHRVASQFGIPLTEMRPALVPLTFDGETLELFKSLSGIALDVTVSCGKTAFRDSMLFTHKGLSGPAILQISSYWREGETLSIDLLPDLHAERFLLDRKKVRAKSLLKTILGEVLPQRLAQKLSENFPSDSPIGEIPNDALKSLAVLLRACKVTPSGTEGYEKAEVTRGGVDTHALSSKTMECTAVPGMYIVGEALDVTGWLGGYNLQWAWSSGWAAGSAL